MCGCCGRNATGSELRKNGIPTTELSLIETFPFKHIIAAKDFMQKELEDEYDTNAEFKSIIDKWMRFSVNLEHTAFGEKWNAKHPGKPVPKQPFYVGGAFAERVTTNALDAKPVKLAGLPNVLAQSADGTIVLYDQAHPSYHLLNPSPVAKQNFRDLTQIWPAMTETLVSGKDFYAQLNASAEAQVEKELEIAELFEEYAIDRARVLQRYPSALHTGDPDQIRWGVETVATKFNGDPELTIMYAFSTVLRDMQGGQRDEVAARAMLVETTLGQRVRRSHSFWAAVMAADETEWQRLLGRAQEIEEKFGDRALRTDGAWSAAAKTTDPKEWQRLLGRAKEIEENFGNTAMGSGGLWSKAKVADQTQWARLVERAEQINDLSADAMKCRALWHVVCGSDEQQWQVVTERVDEMTATAPESLAANGFWELLLKRLTDTQFDQVMVWVGEIKTSKHSNNGVAPALKADSLYTQLAKLAVMEDTDTAQERWEEMMRVFERLAAGAANQDMFWSKGHLYWRAALIELELLMQTERNGMTGNNVPTTNAPNRKVLASFLQSHPADHEIWRDPAAAATGAPRRTAPTDGAPAVQPRKAAKRSVDTSPASSSKRNIMDYFAKSPV
jgi:hypothetical protein